MKKERNIFTSFVKKIVRYLFQVSFITVAVIFGMKWMGNLVEIMCERVSIGVGVFLIFAVACGCIYIDSRNAVMEEKHQAKRHCHW